MTLLDWTYSVITQTSNLLPVDVALRMTRFNILDNPFTFYSWKGHDVFETGCVGLSDFLVHASQMTYSDMLGDGLRLQKWGWRHPGTGSWVPFVACTCSKGMVIPDH